MTGFSLSAAGVTPQTCTGCGPNCTFCNTNPGKCDPGFCDPGLTISPTTGQCAAAVTTLAPVVTTAPPVAVTTTPPVAVTTAPPAVTTAGTSGGGLTENEKIIIATAASVGGVIATLLAGYCLYQLCCSPAALGAARAPAVAAPARVVYLPPQQPAPPVYAPPVYRPPPQMPVRFAPARRIAYPPGYGGFQRF